MVQLSPKILASEKKATIWQRTEVPRRLLGVGGGGWERFEGSPGLALHNVTTTIMVVCTKVDSGVPFQLRPLRDESPVNYREQIHHTAFINKFKKTKKNQKTTTAEADSSRGILFAS